MTASSSRNRAEGPAHPRRVTARIATVALASVLAFLTMFALWASYSTNRAARKANHSIQLSDAYERARFAVAQEESLERKYRLEPSAAVLERHRAAGHDLLDEMEYIRRHGDRVDRGPVDRVVAAHHEYLRATAQMFAAVDARDVQGVLDVDGALVDPIFDSIESQVAAQATIEHDEAIDSLRALRRQESTVLVTTPVAFAIGLALLVAFWMIVSGYRRRAERQADVNRHQALHDALTGLPNRKLFHDRVTQAIRHADRNLVSTALLLLDLDRFKEINDTLGHHCGDRVLVEVGKRLRQTLRDVDTVARLGGDEFAILLPGIGTPEDVGAVASKLLAALQQPVVIDDLLLDVEASIGVSLHPDHANDADELLQQADIAMYAAKATHAGYVVFEPALDQHSPRRLALLGELRRAIENSQLVLHFQPKVEARDGRVIGAEALVRWQHPELGLIPPAEFVPLAERTGLIGPLTHFVLDAALAQYRQWRDIGYDVPVAVNVSARRLLDRTFPGEVVALLDKWAVPPAALVLEITESSIIANPAGALEILERLHRAGVELSIDDFGTGYSSMAYLKDLPVQELKVDRSFVMHMNDNSRDAVIVRSTIDLGKNLGLRVVAEGVEDAPTQQHLCALGCDAVQGYHVCRPVVAEALTQWLAHESTVGTLHRN